MSQECGLPDAMITALREARQIRILTGGGVCGESGVPAFRDAEEGIWAQCEA